MVATTVEWRRHGIPQLHTTVTSGYIATHTIYLEVAITVLGNITLLINQNCFKLANYGPSQLFF